MILILQLLFLCGCLAPRHTWEYLLPDRKKPSVVFGDYRIDIDMRDYNWDKRKDPKEDYDIEVGFQIFFIGQLSDSHTTDSLPTVSCDSACYQLTESERTICQDLRPDGPFHLFHYGDKWYGPFFGGSLDIPYRDSVVILSFVARLNDRQTGLELQRRKFTIELTRFHKRYWILMQ